MSVYPFAGRAAVLLLGGIAGRVHRRLSGLLNYRLPGFASVRARTLDQHDRSKSTARRTAIPARLEPDYQAKLRSDRYRDRGPATLGG